MPAIALSQHPRLQVGGKSKFDYIQNLSSDSERHTKVVQQIYLVTVGVMGIYTCGNEIVISTTKSQVLRNMCFERGPFSFCDVLLMVDGEEYYAHRAVLASVSAVLKRHFERPSPRLSNCVNGMQRVLLLCEPCSPEFEAFLEFVYKGETRMDPAEDCLLELALTLEVETLRASIDAALANNVTRRTLPELWEHTCEYHLPVLRKSVIRFAMRKFCSLNLRELPFRLLERLLQSKRFRKKHQLYTLVKAIDQWVDAIGYDRIVHMDLLLSYLQVTTARVVSRREELCLYDTSRLLRELSASSAVARKLRKTIRRKLRDRSTYYV